MESSPTVAYLQQLFREALNEDEDFASSVFAKRKLESALTYESLIRGVSCGEGEELNSFGNEGEKQAVGEGSSNSTSPQPRNFSPDEQNSMLEMLKNETMFGVISSSPATGATKLIITIIRKLLTSNQFHRDVQRSSVVGVDDDDDESSTPTSATASTKMTQKGRACSAPPMALGLVDVVVTHWLGAEDVGVGSAAANAITDTLILLAAEASSYIPSSSSTSAAQNQNPFLVAMNAIASRTESCLNIVCQGTTLNGTALYRREAEMRLLDALTRAYNEEVNREIELGTMVGLPVQSKGDFSSSRVGGGGEPPITPPSVSPLSLVVSTLASETSVLARLFNDTASGMIALIGKGSRNDAEIKLLRGEILATTSGGIGSNKEGSTRESVVGGGGDQSNDPLMLINTMNTACALGRFVPIALADTTEGNRTNNDSSAIGALSSPSAVNKETREAIRFFSAAARCFLRRAFTTIPPPVHAEANGANRASLAFVPLLSISSSVEGEDMEKEVDPYLSVITPFILRGLATFLRNNSAGLALLLNVTQMKNGQGTLELPSAATILASAAASFSPAQPEKEGPILAISAETIEVAEAFIDFMAAVITQKPNVVSEVRTALAFLESKELRLTKSHENGERTLALASDRLDSELDTLCSIFVAIPTKQALAASSHPIFMSNLLLSQLLYPSKPVPADLKTSALLCVAAVVSSPLFARAHHNKCFKDKNEVAEGDDDNTSIADQGPTQQQQQQQPAENTSMKALKDAFSLKTFNDSVYSHKSSLDESVRRACWHALVAFLQHPLLRVPTAPSIGAHLTGLVTADFAEASLEVRRSQLLCCDLLLKMPEAAPFHEKLKAERRSGIYSKPQPGMTSGASVGTEYAY